MEYDLEDSPIQPSEPPAPPPKPDDSWRKNPKFLAIRGIPAHEVFTRTGQLEPAIIPRGNNPAAPLPKGAKLIKVGKYRGETYEKIKKDDPRYWEWFFQNVLKGKE
jgi:hypothetical protein